MSIFLFDSKEKNKKSFDHIKEMSCDYMTFSDLYLSQRDNNECVC